MLKEVKTLAFSLRSCRFSSKWVSAPAIVYQHYQRLQNIEYRLNKKKLRNTQPQLHTPLVYHEEIDIPPSPYISKKEITDLLAPVGNLKKLTTNQLLIILSHYFNPLDLKHKIFLDGYHNKFPYPCSTKATWSEPYYSNSHWRGKTFKTFLENCIHKEKVFQDSLNHTFIHKHRASITQNLSNHQDAQFCSHTFEEYTQENIDSNTNTANSFKPLSVIEGQPKELNQLNTHSQPHLTSNTPNYVNSLINILTQRLPNLSKEQLLNFFVHLPDATPQHLLKLVRNHLSEHPWEFTYQESSLILHTLYRFNLPDKELLERCVDSLEFSEEINDINYWMVLSSIALNSLSKFKLEKQNFVSAVFSQLHTSLASHKHYTSTLYIRQQNLRQKGIIYELPTIEYSQIEIPPFIYPIILINLVKSLALFYHDELFSPSFSTALISYIYENLTQDSLNKQNIEKVSNIHPYDHLQQIIPKHTTQTRPLSHPTSSDNASQLNSAQNTMNALKFNLSFDINKHLSLYQSIELTHKAQHIHRLEHRQEVNTDGAINQFFNLPNLYSHVTPSNSTKAYSITTPKSIKQIIAETPHNPSYPTYTIPSNNLPSKHLTYLILLYKQMGVSLNPLVSYWLQDLEPNFKGAELNNLLEYITIYIYCDLTDHNKIKTIYSYINSLVWKLDDVEKIMKASHLINMHKPHHIPVLSSLWLWINTNQKEIQKGHILVDTCLNIVPLKFTFICSLINSICTFFFNDFSYLIHPLICLLCDTKLFVDTWKLIEIQSAFSTYKSVLDVLELHEITAQNIINEQFNWELLFDSLQSFSKSIQHNFEKIQPFTVFITNSIEHRAYQNFTEQSKPMQNDSGPWEPITTTQHNLLPLPFKDHHYALESVYRTNNKTPAAEIKLPFSTPDTHPKISSETIPNCDTYTSQFNWMKFYNLLYHTQNLKTFGKNQLDINFLENCHNLQNCFSTHKDSFKILKEVSDLPVLLEFLLLPLQYPKHNLWELSILNLEVVKINLSRLVVPPLYLIPLFQILTDSLSNSIWTEINDDNNYEEYQYNKNIVFEELVHLLTLLLEQYMYGSNISTINLGLTMAVECIRLLFKIQQFILPISTKRNDQNKSSHVFKRTHTFIQFLPKFIHATMSNLTISNSPSKLELLPALYGTLNFHLLPYLNHWDTWNSEYPISPLWKFLGSEKGLNFLRTYTWKCLTNPYYLTQLIPSDCNHNEFPYFKTLTNNPFEDISLSLSYSKLQGYNTHSDILLSDNTTGLNNLMKPPHNFSNHTTSSQLPISLLSNLPPSLETAKLSSIDQKILNFSKGYKSQLNPLFKKLLANESVLNFIYINGEAQKLDQIIESL